MDGASPGDALTFLMIDMVGSTRSWEEAPQPTADVIVTFRDVWAPIVKASTCIDHRDMGDGLFAVFSDAPSAVSAALAIDAGVRSQPWPNEVPSFRMGLYTGTPYSV